MMIPKIEETIQLQGARTVYQVLVERTVIQIMLW